MEKLFKIKEILKDIRQRWDWELMQAETARLAGDEAHFLRAKAGFKATQAAQKLLEAHINNLTGWSGAFPDNVQPLPLCNACNGYIGHVDDDKGCRCTNEGL